MDDIKKRFFTEEELEMMRQSPEAVGARLRRIREQRHMTQLEAAQLIGISAPYLSMIEAGQRRIVTMELANSICSTYCTSQDYILKGTNDQVAEKITVDHRYIQMIQFDHFLQGCSEHELNFCFSLVKSVVQEIRSARNPLPRDEIVE